MMVRCALLASLLLAPLARTRQVEEPADRPREASLVQTVGGFDRPESVAFDLAGEHLFVSHCGSDLFGPERKQVGFVRGRGAISKLALERNGTLRMLAPRFVSALDGPLGLAVLPKATERFPRGTLLVATGLALLVDAEGNAPPEAAQLGTALLLLDPDDGRRLGTVRLDAGSRLAQDLGHALLMPNSLAFDGEGNLYLSDSGLGGERFTPALAAHPGLVRLPHASLERACVIADDPEPRTRLGTSFTPIPGIPNGVGYHAAEDALYVVTMGAALGRSGADVDALYRFDAGPLPAASPAPVRTGIGAADGIAFTPAGTILTSRFSGDLYALPRVGPGFVLPLEPPTPLVAPADHRLLALPDGTCLLAVPEQARSEPKASDQRVRLFRLPRGL